MRTSEAEANAEARSPPGTIDFSEKYFGTRPNQRCPEPVAVGGVIAERDNALGVSAGRVRCIARHVAGFCRISRGKSVFCPTL